MIGVLWWKKKTCLYGLYNISKMEIFRKIRKACIQNKVAFESKGCWICLLFFSLRDFPVNGKDTEFDNSWFQTTEFDDDRRISVQR